MTYEHFSLLAAAVSGSFLLSGALKLRQPGPFRNFLGSVVRSGRLNRVLIVGVPALELLVGVMLLTPLAHIAVVGAAMLSVAFVVFAIRAVYVPDTPGCGCFGTLDATTQHWATLGRAILVAGAAILCFVLSVRGNAVDPLKSSFILMVGLLTGIGIALSMTLLGHVVEFGETLRRLLFRAEERGTANVRV